MSNEYPLLFFPSRIESTKTVRRFRPTETVVYPSAERQSERLAPRFQALQNTLNRGRFQIQDTPDALDAEKVLVIEIVGDIRDFVKTINRIDGLEWMGEVELDELEPDEDFYDNRDGYDLLNGRLYLVSTNTRALTELLSLWTKYKADPKQPFDRGYTQIKTMFNMLKDIHFWGINERFHATGLVQYWQESLQIFPDRPVRFEVELWYKNNPLTRKKIATKIISMIEDLGGRVISQAVIDEIAYHAILGELPAEKIEQILQDDDVELLKCDNVMFLRPTGQMIADDQIDELEVLDEERGDVLEEVEFLENDPVVAILDGMPIENHTLLNGRLIVNDVDQLADRCEVKYRKHGTTMCSLIVKGDLNDNYDFIKYPLYVRPIMEPNYHSVRKDEWIPDDVLVVDLIHRSVKEIFDNSNGQSPAAPTVKVINLSIGLRDRMFFNSMSPLAKLLDWLSYQYNVLFVISAGNLETEVRGALKIQDFNNMSRCDQGRYIINELIAKRPISRILSPAESINGISVGAVHKDASVPLLDNRINPYDVIMPATYSPFGGGYRKSIKPDLVYDGGREFLIGDYLDRFPLTGKSWPKRAPGLSCAWINSLSDTAYTLGTSCSAALVSRNACYLYELIQGLRQSHNIEERYIPLLIKTMMIHGCTWDSVGSNLDNFLPDGLTTLQAKAIKTQWLGYGYPQWDVVWTGTPQKVTAIGFGELKQGDAHIFALPLPPSMVAQQVKKRLIITLSWFSPISPTTQKYRTTKLWYEADRVIDVDRVDVANQHSPKRGTVQHEVLEGSKADVYSDGDSIKVKVNCAEDASVDERPIKYTIMVSLAVAEGIDLPIYQEVRDRLRIPVRVDNAE